tara:strand:- start:2157 stop:2393 length:237 start_codon:yes stop_codon:yes gene_type:complete
MSEDEDNLSYAEMYGPITTKQEKFVKKAEKLGFEVDTYSGRGMYGKYCPSIYVDYPEEFDSRGYRVDDMGKGYVIYCP